MPEVEERQAELEGIYMEVFENRCHEGTTGVNTSFEPLDMSPELEARLEKTFEANPELKTKYMSPADVGERSDREFHLCGMLHASGFSEGEIYTIMTASPQRKWHERGDDYRIPTIRHAIEAENSVLDEARKTLDGLAEKIKADPSAINKPEILQALATLKRIDPIGYGIAIDGLGLTQTVKSAVKERVKMMVDALHGAYKKPQEVQTQPGIIAKAMEILKSGDVIRYILNILKKFHAGDRMSAELLLCSIAIGSCLNAFGTQPKLSGGSGKGKTHLCKALRHLMPQEWILYISLSPKALYRATSPKSTIQIRPGMVIFSDDVRIGEEMEDTLKRSMSNFQEPSSYLVVQDGELQPLHLPERLIWWLTSVQDDQEEQLLNRFFSVGVDESSAQDMAALELTFIPLAEGRTEFLLTEEVQICREILRIIKSECWVVWAPFLRDGEELAVEWQNPEERRNPGRFVDLLAAYAILRSGQREVIDEGDHLKVIATIEDFNSAKALYESRAENLTTKMNDDDLHMVRWLITKANNRPYDFKINDLVKEYKGRNGKGLSSKTLERRLLGRNEKGRTSHGLIHKIRGGGLTVELRSETDEVSGTKKQQKRFYQFTFDPSKFDLLETYSKVVSLKTTDQTHKTPPDQGSGSSPVIPQDSGLEEEKNRNTQQTNNARGYSSEKRTPGCDIFNKKYQIPSQDGSSGSIGSIEEPDGDSSVVPSGSVLVCQRCGQPVDQLIDKPGGSFCPTCVEKFDAEDIARKETPTNPQASNKLATQVEQAITQFEAAGKPIIPAVVAEHLAVLNRLQEVVALIRDMGYAVTQDIDPISHQLIWKLSSPKDEGKHGGFTPEEDEALERTLDRMKRGRMTIMPFSLADMVRSILPIRPARCREWLEAHGWVEQTGQGWVEVGR